MDRIKRNRKNSINKISPIINERKNIFSEENSQEILASQLSISEPKKRRIVLSLPNPYKTQDQGKKKEITQWPIKLENLTKRIVKKS